MTHESPSPDPLAATPYRSIRPIGSGAMGDVIEAEHRQLRKRVVVKLFNLKVSQPFSVAAMEDRFRLEAQALASLDGHPNVVQVSDFGRTRDGQLYLVMQKLEGRTLAEELEARGPVDPGEAVHVISQVLAGLEVVHAAGLVHRDIKPSNLFLCDASRVGGERVVKILDFGIVKLLAQDVAKRGPAPLSVPTAQGTVLGSPRYVAPEQAIGAPVDRRADLYAAGAVLYSLVTGKDPFYDERGVYEILLAHISREPTPASALAPFQIPHALDRAILKALAKRPEDRFASATEFREALARSISASTPRWAVTERLDASVFRAAAPASRDDNNASPDIRTEVARDSGTEVTLHRARSDGTMPAVTASELAAAVAASDRAQANMQRAKRAHWGGLRAAAVGTALLVLVILGVVLALHATGSVP